MDTMNLNGSMEREEGEILDDDLEAISDDSIIVTPAMGKLNSHKESLSALSLSSVSEMEVVEYSVKPRLEKRKSQRRKSDSSKKRRMSKNYHHRHKPKSDSSSDSDDNVSLTKKLLKEAIRIDSKESLNNSLRTRLRGMVTKSTIEEIVQEEPKKIPFDSLEDMIQSPVDSIVDIDTNTFGQTMPCEEITEKEKECQDSPVEIENDNELIQLRLEALKTAVLNKFQHRKKRKINQDPLEKPDNLDINKENSCDNVNTNNPSETNIAIACIEDNCENDVVGNSVNNSEEDEDEDILRAVLLASIAKKITNKVSSPNLKIKVDNKTNNLSTASAATKMSKPHPPLPKPKNDLKVPKIPRFIISVNNSDSNSDDNTSKEERNLKEKSENMKPDIQKEVENEVEKFLKQQRAEVEAKQKNVAKVSAKVQKPIEKATTQVASKIPETNSLYKLLPKSKQLEYEKLIQQIKTAEKKPRTRRLSNRTSDSKNVIKNARAKMSSKTGEGNGSVDKTQMTATLQRTLKDMQTQVNGRLQIKRKYHVLTPLLRKVNEASQEQKKHELRIKHLLSQLKDARNHYQKSQQDFHEVLKEFFTKKEEVDKRPPKDNVIRKPRITSTPKPEGIERKDNVISNSSHPTTKPEKILSPSPATESLQCKVVLEKCPVNLTDPNDIEFKMLGTVDSVPKYTSPLDSKGSLNNKINPLEILCPFEINGSCRDKECTFNHYNKDL